jgi:hypothetical protein
MPDQVVLDFYLIGDGEVYSESICEGVSLQVLGRRCKTQKGSAGQGVCLRIISSLPVCLPMLTDPGSIFSFSCSFEKVNVRKRVDAAVGSEL